MNLSTALGIKRGDSLAFVGAGGKTTAMFALARDLQPPVILTTTTHLGSWQSGFADRHLIIHSVKEIDAINVESSQVLLLTGPKGSDNRLAGLDDDSLLRVQYLCQQEKIPLLIEADGARQRNLKAPEEYEPVIPKWVDHVVVMAGLGGLGQPLSDEFVHRPEQFSRLTGLPLGDTVEIEHLIKILSAKKGGLQGIPGNVKKSLFLNQADKATLQAAGARIARELIGIYDQVLVGSLKSPGPKGAIFAVHTPTAGVILAAGGSERLGTPKQLLEWDGQSYIKQVVRISLTAGLSPIIVVLGAVHQQIEEKLRDQPVKVIYNPDWKDGVSTSIKAGIKALPTMVGSAVFLLCDQPQISPLLIRTLIEQRAVAYKPIIAPEEAGRRSNPVLFGREIFNDLLRITGDKGGRQIFKQHPVQRVKWIDPRINLDVDRPEDEKILLDSYFNIS